MPLLTLKKGLTWTLKARYSNGAVRFLLVSNDDGRVFGDYSDVSLNAKHWERVVKWVGYCEAEEKAALD